MKLIKDKDDELVDVFETDWFRDVDSKMFPVSLIALLTPL